MNYEIVLENRTTGEVGTYPYSINCKVETFRNWLVNHISPITLVQMWNGDKLNNKPEDVIAIGLRCELGELWTRSVEDAKKVYFFKGDWLLP